MAATRATGVGRGRALRDADVLRRRAAAKGIANSTLIEYEGAPHGLFATEKARFTSDLLAFIKR